MDQTRAAVTDGPSARPGWGWALDPKDRGWSGSRGQSGRQEGQSLSWSPAQMSPCLPPNPTPEGPSALDPCLLKHLNQHGSVCSLGEGTMPKAAQCPVQRWQLGTVGLRGRKTTSELELDRCPYSSFTNEAPQALGTVSLEILNRCHWNMRFLSSQMNYCFVQSPLGVCWPGLGTTIRMGRVMEVGLENAATWFPRTPWRPCRS